MNLPVKIRVKQVSKEVLFEACRSEEVLTYCQNCSNYEKNHSCPDFDFEPVKYLDSYQYAMIILTEIDTQPIQSIMNQLDESNFQSRVLRNYKSIEEIDKSSMVSMYAFEEIKNQMSDQLLLLENQIHHSIGLPPGSCTRCAVCSKQAGLACRFPETLRYSLEALGFLVSEIYKTHFDMELGWAKGELPKQFCTCSVLMTKEKSDETFILHKLAGMVLRMKVKNGKSSSSRSSKGTRLKPYEDLSAAGVKRRLTKVARLAIAEYALDVRELSYMTEETNVFFKVIDHRGQIYAMKMYQEESSTLEDNMAEMVFLKQLESVKDIRVPKIISTKDGNRVVVINSTYTPTPKRVILYRWMEGEDLAEHETDDRFFQAGELMAKLHDATHAFKLPESVRPKKWDQVFYFHDEKAVYHEKKYAKLIRPDEIELLDQVIPFLNHHLASYYQMSSPQLIHGDFNPWNLLVDKDALKVIDFDDAQLGYPIFDLAIFLFYYRYDESFDYQQVKKTVLAGYQSVRPLPAFTEFEIELLMTARRVNFVNYVLYMNEEMGEYITNSCNRIREFLKTYDSDLKV